MKEQNNVFVKVSEYKEIMDVLELINAKIREAKETINNLNDLKNKEEAEIEKWAQTFINIEKKASDIRSLMAPFNEL